MTIDKSLRVKAGAIQNRNVLTRAERIARTLRYKDAPPLPDPRASLLAVLERPTGTPPLAQLAQGRKDACILICDITRPVPNEMILRPVLQTLEAAGIPRDKITIL